MENKFNLHRLSFLDDSLPIFKENKAKGYITYGLDNLYPQELIRLYNSSPKHNAIINQKAAYIVGANTDIKGKNTQDVAITEDFLANINAYEDFENLKSKLAQDYELFDGFAVEVIWNKAKTKPAEYYHLPFQNVRLGKECAYYSEDWGNQKIGITDYPYFNATTRENKQVFYFKLYRAGQKEYPLPSYIGALRYIEIDSEIQNWHFNSIKNGFSAQTLIQFFKGIPTPEEMRMTERRFKSQKTGTHNAGGMIIGYNEPSERPAEITNLQPSDFDKQFLQLNDTVRDEIFVGHRISNPVLFGISTAGALGQRNELIEAYELFQQAYIEPRQKQFDAALNSILKYAVPCQVVTINKPPIGQDYVDLFTKGIITNDEARAELGFEVLTTTKTANTLNDSINSLSPLVANNVLSNMTVNEKRQLAGLPPIANGDVLSNGTAVALSSNYTEDDVVNMFMECGEDKENFEDVKMEFATAIETAILQLLNANDGTTTGELAKYLKIEPQKVVDTIAKMTSNGLIDDVKGKLSVSKLGTTELKKVSDQQIEIRYEYALDPAFSGERKIIKTSREFCRQLVSANRLYLRSEIDTISARVGRDIWTERGGWYTIPDTTVHIHHCRHIWNSKLVRKKI
jgi:DNA-binding Lrp family transcriptional regulator